MKLRSYLLIALAAFVVAVTGSDLYARVTLTDMSLMEAFGEHLQWASMTIFGVFFLLVPFLIIAFIGAALNKRVRTRIAAGVFAVGIMLLLYFYFDGFQAAEQAMLDERWTAAALSIGLLPFIIGIPTILIVALAGAVAARFDRGAGLS